MHRQPSIHQTIESLKIIQQGLCAYRSSYGKKCDCKFGVKLKNELDAYRGREGTGCGCPELYTAIAYLGELAALKDEQED